MTKFEQNSEIDTFSLVKRMAFLRREFLGRNRLLTDGPDPQPHTIYFYDTDVITAYCQPWTKGAGSVISQRFRERQTDINKKQVGYGEPLPINTFGTSKNEAEANQDIANRLAEMLTRYALIGVRQSEENSPSQNLPIYQFPGHYDETRRIFRNARKFAAIASDRGSGEADKNALRRAAAVLASVNMQADNPGILNILTNMIEQMAGKDMPLWRQDQIEPDDQQRMLEWKRFEQLHNLAGGIFSTEQATDHAQQLNLQPLERALSGLTKLSGDEAAISSEIIEHAKQQSLDQPDGEAIALLYTLNARLNAESDRPGAHPWRAVFVTGAHSLADFCYKIGSPKIANEIGLDPDISKRFSQNFVRHIFAYTTEAILEPDYILKRRFIGWLDGALGMFSDSDGFHENELTKLYNNPQTYLQDYPDASTTTYNNQQKELLRNWNKIAKQAIARERFATLGLDSREAAMLRGRVLAVISKWRTEGYSNWQSMVDEMQEEYERSRDRVYLNYSIIGRNALFFRDTQDRNPPDLYFGSFKNANYVFKNLCRAEPYNQEDFRRDFEAVTNDFINLHVEDDLLENYVRFVVLGAAFASMNRWAVALSQGQNALSITERQQKRLQVRSKDSDGGGSLLTGREAYFLCAVSQRLAGDSDRDFDRAEKFLYKAERALTEEQEFSNAPVKPWDRHLGERLAIALSRYYFTRYRNEVVPVKKSLDSTKIDHHRLATGQALRVFEKARDVLNALPDTASEINQYYQVTIANIATNILQVAIIQAFRKYKGCEDKSNPVQKSHVVKALKVLEYLLGERENQGSRILRNTKLMRKYVSMASLLVGEQDDRTSNEATSKETHSKDAAETPDYDAWRYQSLESFRAILEAMAPAKKGALLD